MRLDDIPTIERLAARSWPAHETVEVDGWVLRFSDGITRRANSAFTGAGAGNLPLDDRIDAVVSAYRDRGLPPRVQVSPASRPAGLDERLSERGFVAEGEAIVQTALLADVQQPAVTTRQLEMTTEGRAPDGWASAWWTMERGTSAPAGLEAIVTAAAPPVRYVTIRDAGGIVALGRGNVEDGWLGIVAMATREDHRRRGLARQVLAALCQWGTEHAAAHAYLQVETGNLPAQSLYRSAGFVDTYRYHYRLLD